MKVKKLTPTAILPTRAYNSNGYDLYADQNQFIPIGETCVISTGISIELAPKTIRGIGRFAPPQIDPSVFPVFKIEDRSSLAAKGLRTGAGVVDFDYRGEIKIVMHNFSAFNHHINGDIPGWKIKKGDKIAQGLIYYTLIPEIEVVSDLSETDRNSQGFGSSGAV